MKFHTGGGNDYYSEHQNQKDKSLLEVVKQSIDTFNWANHNIKDERTRETLAIFISDEISRWRSLDCS